MDLLPLVQPQSVAIVGASRDPKKIGSQILANLLKGNFQGKLFPINPKAETIQGHQSFSSLTEVKEKIDLVIIAVPQTIVEKIVDDCITKQVGAVIVITAGFKEIDEQGAKLEHTIAQKLRKAEIPLLGPNCLGIINPLKNLNASFAAEAPKPGNVALISQSGAFGTAAIDWAQSHNIGFSLFVSLGNKAQLTENQFLQLPLKETRVIAMYLEDIANGAHFIHNVQTVTKEKPVLILKPGKSEKAQTAVKSHTGALTGEDAIVTTALQQAGAIRVDTIQQLFDLIKAFSLSPELKGKNIAIITNAGGPGIVATDAIETSGLRLAPISLHTQGVLNQYLPREANIHDPIDLIGDAKADRYDHALDAVLKEESVHGVIIILTPQSSTEIQQTAEVITKHARLSDKPIIASFLGGTLVDKGIETLHKNNIPCYHYPEQAVYAFSKMWEYNLKKETLKQTVTTKNVTYIPSVSIQNIFRTAKNENRSQLSQNEVELILSENGIPFPSKKIVTSAEDAWQKAKELGTPVVMKLFDPKLIHKTEEGGVILNLHSPEQVKDAVGQMKLLEKKLATGKSSIYIQKQIDKGVELLLGMKRDPVFGPVIVVGSGGIFTEIYQDVASHIAPLTKNSAIEMLKHTKIYKILTGFRGQSYDIEPVIQSLLALSNLSLTYPEIKEIDINPLNITEHTTVALDARILL